MEIAGCPTQPPDIPHPATDVARHHPMSSRKTNGSWLGYEQQERDSAGASLETKKTTLGGTTMKKTMIALAMVCAAGLTVTNLHAAATPAAGKTTAPAQDLVIKGKKPALFSHAKHTALGLDCTACHHDAKHQPLNEAAIAGLGKTDGLQCVSCHNEKFANAKLQKPMDVFHARCKTCHTTGINGKKGPTACIACHKAAAAPKQKAAPAETAAPAKKKSKAVEGC
jgi:hypothetical protein